jgi:hypothetical protein
VISFCAILGLSRKKGAWKAKETKNATNQQKMNPELKVRIQSCAATHVAPIPRLLELIPGCLAVLQLSKNPPPS